MALPKARIYRHFVAFLSFIGRCHKL
jgi:hypothetical protein